MTTSGPNKPSQGGSMWVDQPSSPPRDPWWRWLWCTRSMLNPYDDRSKPVLMWIVFAAIVVVITCAWWRI